MNIEAILKDDGAELFFEETIASLSKDFSDKTVSLPVPLIIKGAAMYGGGIIKIDAVLKGSVTLGCGRCLNDFEYPVNIIVDARSTEEIQEDNPDFFYHTGKEIDLTAIAEEFLITNLPIERVCSADCKGICPDCGVNLNTTECRCSKDDDNDIEGNKTLEDKLNDLQNFFKG